MVWDCKWAKFIHKQQELWPLIDVKMLFPDSNLSSMDIDIREEWFGIANGQIRL